jgi:hypothetical protein
MSKNQKFKNKFQNYFVQVVLILQKTLFFHIKLKQLITYYFYK